MFKLTIRFLLVALATGLAADAFSSGARAQTARTCLVVSNAWYTPTRDKTISITVDEQPGGFWPSHFHSNDTVVSSPSGVVRGSSFTIHIYDGDQGSSGALLATSTSGPVSRDPHILWTFVAPGSTNARTYRTADCDDSGYWLALVHD
jgi:hypothetical protein